MTEKDVIKAIDEAKKTVKNKEWFMSWDLGKWIDIENDGCCVEFDVIHKDELETSDIYRIYTFIKEIEAELLKLPDASESGRRIFLKGVDGYKLRDAFIRYCQKEHVKVWGEKKDEDDLDGFSVFLNW